MGQNFSKNFRIQARREAEKRKSGGVYRWGGDNRIFIVKVGTG